VCEGVSENREREVEEWRGGGEGGGTSGGVEE